MLSPQRHLPATTLFPRIYRKFPNNSRSVFQMHECSSQVEMDTIKVQYMFTTEAATLYRIKVSSQSAPATAIVDVNGPCTHFKWRNVRNKIECTFMFGGQLRLQNFNALQVVKLLVRNSTNNSNRDYLVVMGCWLAF